MVLSGWSPPVETDSSGNTIIKSELEWSIEDDKLSAYNSKALHAIFNGVGEGYIKLISSCVSAKEAWEILQTQFEGTSDVKRSRFIMLQTKFDELRMSDNETLTEFYEKLSDIANEYFALGEKLDDSVLVRKIVRVLPERFDTKLLAMEEAKDFSTMKVEELMGSLRTFELNQQIKQKDKPKSIADKGKSIALKVADNENSDSECDDEIALLTKNFQKYMKKMGNKKNISKGSKGNTFIKPSVSNKKGIQCRECEGFGHIQSECANTLKKNKKSFNVTWSDDETESDEDITENVALTSVMTNVLCDSQVKDRLVCLNNTTKQEESDSDESEICEESLAESYKVMYEKWIQVASENRELNKLNKKLSHQIEMCDLKIKEYETSFCDKDEKISLLKKELENFKKNVQMLNPGSSIFEKAQNAGQRGFAGLGSNGMESSGVTKFVKSSVPTNHREAPNSAITVSQPVAARTASDAAKSPGLSKE